MADQRSLRRGRVNYSVAYFRFRASNTSVAVESPSEAVCRKEKLTIMITTPMENKRREASSYQLPVVNAALTAAKPDMIKRRNGVRTVPNLSSVKWLSLSQSNSSFFELKYCHGLLRRECPPEYEPS